MALITTNASIFYIDMTQFEATHALHEYGLYEVLKNMSDDPQVIMVMSDNKYACVDFEGTICPIPKRWLYQKDD